ncbi:phosphoenolpyruvate--protein phosphotransferase [Breoghania sp.]|uniref:phosphoenolpyruvate--protein phosphotransferase n=1 Tax=Breoghania sp. TaxID=2065378 RepID=UPI0029C9CC0D|nr:phosphoenolpyruvate--protein phosphotransferase [Breoghania sp.]
MIGIVIVSHSKQLADGLKELADTMSMEPVPIVSAGGIDDPDNPLGTDAIRILDAINEVMNDDGVLVFFDLGSAKLNAEMALDLLDDEAREKVRICEAPLVEGVLNATVQAAAGQGMDVAIAEARATARAFVDDTGAAAAETPADVLDGLAAREFRIRTVHGLHARPAAQFVQTASRFEGPVYLANLTRNRPPANAKSINGVMLSEVGGNDVIRLSAEEAVAEDLFAAIAALVEANFGEAERAPEVAEASGPASVEETAAEPATAGVLEGARIARGFAHGPIRQIRRALPETVEAKPVADAEAELSRFHAALQAAEGELSAALAAKGQAIADYDRKIFDAHIAFLHDPALIEPVETAISARKVVAEAPWRDAVDELSTSYRGLGDPILKARGEDVIDVGLRVLAHLTGGAGEAGNEQPAILAFDELRPSDVLTLERDTVLGIAAAYGGATSHAGILASGLPVPVVFGLGNGLLSIAEGTDCLLDGGKAELTVAPDAALLEEIEQARAALEERCAKARAIRHDPAVTADGEAVRAAANLASLEELASVVESGAEEVGLLRTEFLFMRRESAPDEDEQYAIYKQMVEGLDGRPLTVRTVDIGGDKPVAYMDRPAEENPNLGWRGIRYSLDVPELFETQLVAILRASAHGPVRIMFPLVASVEEVLAGKAAVERAMAGLTARGEAFDAGIEVGIMIEVPAAAEIADRLAPEVDFFSIGTNDLTQYVMAADRANPKVQDLCDPFHPAVLAMIAKSIRAAKEAGIWIGMCGAMAGDPLAVPILLGLGLDEFSMSASDVAEFKLTLKGLSRAECEALAARALEQESAAAVRGLVVGAA